MFFPSKKKRLWRACVTQYAGLNAATETICSQQQQQPHHQHQHHPLNIYQQTSTVFNRNSPALPRLTCLARCCCNTNSEGFNSNNQTPITHLPSSCGLLDSYCHESNGLCPNMNIDSEIDRRTDSESDNAMVMSDAEGSYSITSGCYYESYGDKVLGDNRVQQSNKITPISGSVNPLTVKTFHRPTQGQFQRDANTLSISTPPTTPPSPISMTVASVVVATATSVFRNCCGGGCLSTTSTDSNLSEGGRRSHNPGLVTITNSLDQINNIPSSTAVLVDNLKGNNNNNCNMRVPTTTPAINAQNSDCPSGNSPTLMSTASCCCSANYIPCQVNDPKDVFAALMKKLKDHQRATLLEAVENRFAYSTNGRQPDCVLVQRGLIMGEEPNFVACRLWFWADLNHMSQLKRIPSCPNGKDRVYVCCNPTHWSRILVPETAPPPYRRCVMDRLRPEGQNSSNGQKDSGSITTINSDSCNSTVIGVMPKSSGQPNLRVQVPESFTTEGQDLSIAPWCQVLYWELAQRVGDRYLAKHSSINIYSEGPSWSNNGGNHVSGSNDTTKCGEICLKDLAEKRKTASPECVQKIRQKIGLGIILSQEADGVWLYNRSAAPIFVSSPTLNDFDWWFHVSKVPPGYCLKAFDIHRVRMQPQEVASAQQGPIDKFCMRISFVKGWGPKYCRREIFTCPCWLEVIFTRR